jgi:hypothetical protein
MAKWLGVFVFVGVFSMVVVERAEADAITVLSQSYSASGSAVCSANFFDPPCFSFGQSNSPTPLSFSGTDPSLGSVFADAIGAINPSGGSLRSDAGVSYMSSFTAARASSSAVVDFQVNTPAEAVVDCHAGSTFFGAFSSFVDVTTNTVLLQCSTDNVNPSVSKSGIFFLTTDIYGLSTSASGQGGPTYFDSGFATINIQVPEPSTFCLLGIGLLALPLLRRLKAPDGR